VFGIEPLVQLTYFVIGGERVFRAV